MTKTAPSLAQPLSLLFDPLLSSVCHNSSPDIKLRLDRPGQGTVSLTSVSLRAQTGHSSHSSGCPQTRKVRTGPGSLSSLTSLALSNCQTIKNMSIVFCISCSSSTLYVLYKATTSRASYLNNPCIKSRCCHFVKTIIFTTHIYNYATFFNS